MEAEDKESRRTEQVLVRVSPELFAALQLALPFEKRRSMQDLVGCILNDFVDALAARDPGFRAAMTGLAESRAERSGILAKRRASRQRPGG